MVEKIRQGEITNLPSGANLILNEKGEVVGIEVNRVLIDAEDFDQATVDALNITIANPPSQDEVLKKIS